MMPFKDADRAAQYKREWAEKNREKIKEVKHAHYISHKEEVMSTVKVWRERNRDAYLKSCRSAYMRRQSNELTKRKQVIDQKLRYERDRAKREANPELYSSKKRETSKRQASELSDGYVKSVLTHRTSIKASEIPNELLEAKRQQLKLDRIINELKKGQSK